MKKNIQFITSVFLCMLTYTTLWAQINGPIKYDTLSVDTLPPKNFIIEYELTGEGDTIYLYKHKAFDFGNIYKEAPKQLYNEKDVQIPQEIGNERKKMATIDRSLSIDTSKNVKQIGFTEGITRSGGKTYSIPIITAAVSSSAPEIAIAYNSQAGNGVAGYGWNLAGASAITVTGKTIYYDNTTAPMDLSKPGECVFALDGTRLVSNTGSLTEYQYETAQGFVLVRKHLYGANVAYFTVAYPNGSTARFGFANNTAMKHTYPIKEITDIKGYKINFDYIESGNNYYLSKVSYGGKTAPGHQAEIQFNYDDRTDFTTAYISTIPVSANKLLKSVVSRNKVSGVMQELYTYSLTHVLNDNVQRLTQIGCTSGTSSLNPLSFSYGDYINNQPGRLTKEYSKLLFKYFPNTSDEKLVFKRGKFIKNKFGDGLISFPGKFSSYTKTGERVKKLLGKVIARYAIFGSGYPADQNILIAPGLSFLSDTQTIQTGEGFQTIEAVDVNGNGVDEIVKVNFGDLSGDNTMLKINIYTHSGSTFSPDAFTVPVKGVVDNRGKTYSPMSRLYFFGDFKGTGKAQLLTVSHSKAFTGEDMTSYFALIDLDSHAKVSETALFTVDTYDSRYIYPLDMDGDGKMELCYATSSGLDVYGLSGNSFSKLYTTSSITRSQFDKDPVLGDLNADGKVDILVPPANSYRDLKRVDLPIWAPHHCPFCRGGEPLCYLYDTHCRHCHKDLNDSYVSKLKGARCRMDNCDTQLNECHNKNSYNPGNDNKLCCPTHGFMFTGEVDFGYIDNGNSWTAYLSTGKGFATSNMSIVKKESADGYVLMDINSDGNADLLRTKNDQVTLFLNKNGIIQTVSAGAIPIPSDTKILPANVCDYYSMSHFIAVENAEVNCYKFTKNSSKANLLTELTDSYGNSYKSEYVGMNEQGSHYYPTNTYRTYPYFSFIAPLNLLNRSTAYTSNYTLVKNYKYSYYSAVMHRTGLGFVGFEKVVTNDQIQNITVEETKDPELFGVTTKVISSLKEVFYKYNRNQGSYKKCNPQLTSVFQKDKIKNIFSITAYSAYDAYNNPAKVVVSLLDKSLLTVTNQTYANITNSTRYLIGQPLQKTVTRTRDGNTWKDKEVITYHSNYLPATKTTYTGVNGDKKTGFVKWEYYPDGLLKSEKSAPYNVSELLGSTYEYDSQGRVTKVTDAMGLTTQYLEYNKFGKATKVKDFRAHTTVHNYDNWGQLTSIDHPDGVSESTTAAWGGQGLYTVTKTATGKPAVITHYDALGREIRTGNQRFDGTWQYVDKVYDAKGRVEKTSLPFKGSSATHWNTYTYDTYNRPTKITEVSGKTTTWHYNGLSVTETRNGMFSKKTSDASGTLIKVEDPGGIIEYKLRPDGQPAKIIAPGGIETSFGYDAFGRQTSITDPSAGTQTFTENYTAAGMQTRTVKDARDKVVTTVSDKYGRVTSVNRPEFNTSYVYNTDGLLTHETSTNGTSAVFTYDTYGRPATVRENAPDGKFLLKTFAYAEGNVASVQYASQSGNIATENFMYANGHNTEIKLNNTTSIWKLTEENALGQPTKATTGSMARTYGYTAYGMPTGRTAGNIQNFSYSFDPHKGNLISRTDNKYHKTEHFKYDHLNRLSEINGEQIGYAPNGNITHMPGTGTLEYTHPEKPYAVTKLAFTGSGIDTKRQSIDYTSFQRPKYLFNEPMLATFIYNASGERVKMLVSPKGANVPPMYQFHYENTYISNYEHHSNGGREILYLGGDAYSAPAVYVKQYSGDWEIYYICRDYLGSITHIANADGSLKEENSYNAWGRLRSPETHELLPQEGWNMLFLSRGYTGHEQLDVFGLINMNARLYDPAIGRFLSPDPYVQAPNFTQNFNRYSYALNNPLVYVDEDGEIIEWIIGGLLIGAYIGASKKGGSWNPAKWEGNWWQGAIWGGAIGALTGGIAGSIWAAGGTINFGISVFGKEIPALVLTKAGAETGGLVTLGIGGTTAATSIATYTFGHRKETPQEKIKRIFNTPDPKTNPSLPIAGAGTTALSEMYYSKTYNTWMGKNYKVYKQTWGGNGATGGKIKYGKRISKYFKFFGYGIGAYSAADIQQKRVNGDIGWTKWTMEQGSNAISTLGGEVGAAWGIGWELGRSVKNTEWYQKWKFNFFYNLWERKYGKPCSANECMWNYFYQNYKP